VKWTQIKWIDDAHKPLLPGQPFHIPVSLDGSRIPRVRQEPARMRATDSSKTSAAEQGAPPEQRYLGSPAEPIRSTSTSPKKRSAPEEDVEDVGDEKGVSETHDGR